MKKNGKKAGRMKVSQVAMRNPKQNKRSVSNLMKLGKVSRECYDELNDSEEELHINPLPTPAFVHRDAANTPTPRFRFSPSLNPKLHRRVLNEYAEGF